MVADRWFRRIRSTLLIAAMIGVVVACGSSGGSDDESSGSIAAVRDAITEKGYECSGKPEKYQPGEDEIDVGIEPVRTLSCTVDGRNVELTEFASTEDVARMPAVVQGFACEFAAEPTKVTWATAIVGTVTSPLDHAVDGSASVLAMCFDEAGKPLTTHSGSTDGDNIAAKGSASFAIDLFESPCPVYLVGSSLYDY